MIGGGGGALSDKGLRLSLMETLRMAWADPELRTKLIFILGIFAVFVFGLHVPVPIPGVSSADVMSRIDQNVFLQLMSIFGGGALRRLSVFALGLNPYITASIIMQIMTTAVPKWKQELQEGGQYARQQQNRRTRALTLVLCVAQSLGLLQILAPAMPDRTFFTIATVVIFWTAGAMFILWLGEQISEKGIGNGVSLMIFAGIIVSMPFQFTQLYEWVRADVGATWYRAAALGVVFLATTWFIVYFTTAQRRIPIQHMRRTVGTKVMGGQTSYLPLSVNMAGVIPIIFAVALIYIPAQFASMFPTGSTMESILTTISRWLSPGFQDIRGIVGCFIYSGLIFFFTYFYTAVQYNVEDIANNLKRGGSFVPGVRPGKQTKDFLDGVISRITVVGAAFLAAVALVQYLAPVLTGAVGMSVIGGTSLLIMVTVALETMRQIEANLLMKQYGQ
jgi:preprotein translocase subunit SecY